MYDVKTKERNLAQYNNYTFAKTLSMFEYSGLPETIPYFELEKLLQKSGYAFITKHEGKLYAFNGGIGGEQDVYGNATQITINNVALGLNKTFNLEDDGVLIINDDCRIGLLPMISKFNSALVENDINLYMAGINSRMQTLISASDDKTKASADEYIKKLVDGDVTVIGEAALFDGIKRQDATSNSGSGFTALIEFHQYVKAGLHNELGLNSNFNMKRERLTSGEVESVEDTLYPFIDNMMKCRLKGIEKVNEKYGETINVDYGSVWNKKQREMVDDIIEGELPSNTSSKPLQDNLQPKPLPESLDESLNESIPESTDEPTDETTDELIVDIDEAEVEAEVVLTQVEEVELMLEDETLSEDERETLVELLAELKGE